MKIKILLIFFVLTSNICLAISEITVISNGVMFAEYDIYSGAVLRYENRIIARSLYKITEYNILDDGLLYESYFHETKNSGGGYNFIDGDKYYFVKKISYIYNSSYHVTVFDLTQSPMKMITTFDTNVTSSYETSIYFTESHFMITDFLNKRVVCINKNTYIIDGFIDGTENHLYAGKSVVKDNYLIQGVTYDSEQGSITFLRFYNMVDLHNNKMDLVCEVELEKSTDHDLINLQMQGDLLIVTQTSGVFIIDISDVLNPMIIHNLKLNKAVRNAIYTENMIIVTYLYENLMEVFEYKGDENYESVHNKIPYFLNSSSCILMVNNFLYWNNGYGFNVYDISDNFKQIKEYGNFDRSQTFPNTNDIYFIKDSQATHTIDIYSILDASIITNIKFDQLTEILYLKIKGEMLYITKAERINNVWQYAFDIYRIENKQAILLTTQPLYEFVGGRFFVGDKRVFIDLWRGNRIRVYDINDNYELINMTEYTGTMQLTMTNPPDDHIFTYNGNNVTLRSQDDFNDIIVSGNISMKDQYLWYYGENYFFIINTLEGRYAVYNYSIEKGNINLHYRFAHSPESYIYPFNQIITKNATHIDKSIYYTIIDGQVTEIGEKFDNRAVLQTFFFPEKKKMVQIAGSGIWVYDFDYKVSETDVVSELLPTGLIGNYPNPFNPTTAIKFRAGNLEFGAINSHVQINIFNIKGQKVRSLVNEVYPVGEHVIVWNGKDDNGDTIPSGIYLCKMTSAGYNSVIKMLLVK